MQGMGAGLWIGTRGGLRRPGGSAAILLVLLATGPLAWAADSPRAVAAAVALAPSRESTAAALLEPVNPRPYEQLRPELVRLSIPPTRPTTRRPTLVDRPIVLDFRHQSVVLGYRTRRDDFSQPAPAPGFPGLTLATRAKRREGFVEVRRRLGDDFELGVHVPWLGLEEARPTRILPLVAAPFFTTAEDVRGEDGIGDVTLSLARGFNRPGLSRRLALDVKLDNGRTSIPDASSLPLGTGQRDYTLSYGIKRTRGSFAITGQAGLGLRDEGSIPTFSGTSIRYQPGNHAFVGLRGDKRLEDWWTASLAVTALASERDSLGGIEQAGSSRQIVAVTPSLTYQASDVFEVLASATYSPVAHNAGDAPEFEVALRWRH